MKWITRAHVHVDRVACPWLIKRFVDAEAEFIFVARDLVDIEAKRLNAIPFDAPGVELGHQDCHCSFVSIVKKYNLKDPALLKMAEVVDAADTGKMDQSPYAAGLEAIAQGYSMLYPDDHKNIEHQFRVYDALYNYFKLHGSE
jgi:hypothetical protein